MIELYTLTKIPPHATINENERIGCLIRNSSTLLSPSFLCHLSPAFRSPHHRLLLVLS